MFASWIRNTRWLFAVALFYAFSLCFAQFSGSIQGTVTDTAGSVVPAASLELKALDIGVSYKGTSNPEGEYNFPSLRPGRYELTVSAAGFGTSRVSFQVNAEAVTGQVVQLAPGSQSTEVKVSAINPIGINPTETRVQTTLDSAQISALPVLGRGIYNLVQVTPGVTGLQGDTTGVTPPDNFTIGSGTVNASVSGRPNNSNNFLIDGVSLLSTQSQGAIDITPNPDSIQEVAFQTQVYNVDQGDSSALVANFTSKSGTNQFHGDGDWTYSSANLSANRYGQATNQTTGKPLQVPFHRNYFLGSIGGPVIKDKTFVFGSFQIKRGVEGGNSFDSWVIPDALVQYLHTAYPSSNPAAILAQFPIDPHRIQITSTTTLGDATKAATGQANCVSDTVTAPCTLPVVQGGVVTQSPFANGDQWDLRGDQYFRSGNDRISAGIYRYSQQSAYLTSDRPTFGDSTTPSKADFANLGYTHIFSPSLLNEARVAFLRTNSNSFSAGPYTTFPNLGLVFGPTFYCFFCAELGPYGYGINKEHQLIVADNVHWTRGKHAFKFGFQFANKDYYIDNSGNYARPYNVFYGNIFDLLAFDSSPSAAAYYTIGIDGKFLPQVYGAQAKQFAFLYNDEFRIRPNLLLTYGLRYDNWGNPEKYGKNGASFAAVIVPDNKPTVANIAQASSVPVNRAYSDTPQLIQPRAGFNWTPNYAKGKLSIRGGVGLYADSITLSTVASNLPTNVPKRLTINYPAVGISTAPSPIGQLSQDGIPPFGRTYPTVNVVGIDSRGGVLYCPVGVTSCPTAVFPAGINGLARNLKPQKSINFSLGLEQQFPANLVFAASYVGSSSYDQVIAGDYNALPLGQSATTEFGQIVFGHNAGESNYSALVTSLRQRIGSLNWSASYTWGHSLSDALGRGPFGSGTYVNGPYDQKRLYGSTSFDTRNRFTVFGTYQVPEFHHSQWLNLATSGWTISTITIAQSGQPYTIFVNGPTDGSANNDQRNGLPDLVSQNAISKLHRGLGRSQYRYGAHPFSASDFATPAAGTLGNEPYNGFIGPGYFKSDLGVGKALPLPWFGDRKSNLTIRAELVNVLNRANLGTPDSNSADAYDPTSSGCKQAVQNCPLGEATGSYLPRFLQLQARFEF